MNRIILTCAAIGLLMGSSSLAAEETGNEVTVGTEFYEIMGDAGRFREDRYKRDSFTGGIQSMIFDSDHFDLSLRAIGHDEYRFSSKLIKEDFGYVSVKGQWARRWFDGSNEYWSPQEYGLTGAEVITDLGINQDIDDGFYRPEDFADRPDSRMHADRLDLNLELGLTLPDLPEFRLGWHRWDRYGQELLLRGERTRITTPNDRKSSSFFPRFRGIPTLAHIDGTSDLFYVDISHKLLEKHLLRFRQEFESYRDSQHIEFPRYMWNQTTPSAVIDQYRTFHDDPRFRTLVSLLSGDFRLSKDTLLTAGYMYANLKNESAREVIRPSRGTLAQRLHTAFTGTKNVRRTHVGTTGLRMNKFLGVDDLDINGGLRGEIADTDSRTALYAGGTAFRDSRSTFDEWGLTENLDIRFRGVPDTQVSARFRFEQGEVEQDEFADRTSHEIETVFASGFPLERYQARINRNDAEYGLAVVNRSLPVKLEAGLKYKHKERDYTILLTSDPRFYPGRIGGLDVKTKEASFGVSKLLPKKGNVAVKYQFRREDIKTPAAQGETQDWRIHRVAASLGGSPVDKLYAMSSLILEFYRLDTPVDILDTTSHWAYGQDPYYYEADYVTWLSNLKYDFTSAFSATADGLVSNTVGPNDYRYYKLGAGLSYKILKNSIVSVGGEYFNFKDNAGRGFDDYSGYGLKTSYTYSF